MTIQLWLALGALLAAATGAQARQDTRTPAFADPADAGVAVPAAAYASALTDYAPAAKGAGPSPDRSWRAANAAVGAPSGGLARAGHAGHHAPAPAPAPAPASAAAPAQPPQRAEPAPGHQHQHHRGEAQP